MELIVCDRRLNLNIEVVRSGADLALGQSPGEVPAAGALGFVCAVLDVAEEASCVGHEKASIIVVIFIFMMFYKIIIPLLIF